MFSSVVKHIKASFANDMKKTVCLFLLWFQRPGEMNGCWDVALDSKQVCLCLDVMPKPVHDLYKQSHNGTETPKERDILEALRSLTSGPNRYFILLDALDECTERDDLSDVISQILGRTALVCFSRVAEHSCSLIHFKTVLMWSLILRTTKLMKILIHISEKCLGLTGV